MFEHEQEQAGGLHEEGPYQPPPLFRTLFTDSFRGENGTQVTRPSLGERRASRGSFGRESGGGAAAGARVGRIRVRSARSCGVCLGLLARSRRWAMVPVIPELREVGTARRGDFSLCRCTVSVRVIAAAAPSIVGGAGAVEEETACPSIIHARSEPRGTSCATRRRRITSMQTLPHAPKVVGNTYTMGATRGATRSVGADGDLGEVWVEVGLRARDVRVRCIFQYGRGGKGARLERVFLAREGLERLPVEDSSAEVHLTVQTSAKRTLCMVLIRGSNPAFNLLSHGR